MAEKRRALGRGLGALIPTSAPSGAPSPVDVFFPQAKRHEETPEAETATDAATEPAGVAESAAQGSRPAATEPDVRGEGAGQTRETDEPQAPAAEQAAAPDLSTLSPVPGAEFAELPTAAIRPNPKQPRQVFDEDHMAELVHSIREIGVLQPIVVRRVSAAEAAQDEAAADAGVQYELIMGERRWRATQAAGLEVIPAIIKDTKDDDLLRDALLENLHRSQLNALEEAAAYQQLLDDFGCSHEELATRIGRSRPQISNTLRLLKLPPLVQRRVAAGVLSAGHARALLGLADAAAMERMAQRVVAEGLSVRNVEELVTLGGDDAPAAKRKPRAGTRHPQLDDLTASLSDHLETRTNIALGQRKGKISIEFASMEDLKRILALMGITKTAAPDASEDTY